MAILGIQLDKTNPPYTIRDFTFWLPQFKKFCETEDGQFMFEKLYPIANNKIFKSIFGTDWEYAMALCIAHYSYLISVQNSTPAGDTLSGITGGGVTRGVLSSATIGSFSKSYNLEYTGLTAQDALFWNQSAYGMSLYALYKTKAVPSIFVVTDGPLIPGTPPFNPWFYKDKNNPGGGWWPF